MKDCQKYQEMLTDLFYEEIEMTAELEEHLAECQSCQDYWNELVETGETLDLLDFEPELDMRDIRKAFVMVEEEEKKKEGVKEILLFALLGLGYFLLAGLIFTQLGVKYLLYYQLYIYLGLPLFAIPLLRAKKFGASQRREGGHNGRS